MCLHSLGRARDAEAAVASLRAAYSARPSPDAGTSPVEAARELARYHAWTGDPAQSLAWLERAFAISPEGEDLVIIVSGVYDKVREDPAFSAGIRRIQTQIHQRIQRVRGS
jgi:hypothetical protein